MENRGVLVYTSPASIINSASSSPGTKSSLARGGNRIAAFVNCAGQDSWIPSESASQQDNSVGILGEAIVAQDISYTRVDWEGL